MSQKSTFQDEDDDVQFISSTPVNRAQSPLPAASLSQRHPASFTAPSTSRDTARPSAAAATNSTSSLFSEALATLRASSRPSAAAAWNASSSSALPAAAASLNPNWQPAYYPEFDYLDFEDDDAYRASSYRPPGFASSSSLSRNPAPWLESLAAASAARHVDNKEKKERLLSSHKRAAEFVNDASKRMRDSAKDFSNSLKYIEYYYTSAENEAKNATQLTAESLAKIEKYLKDTNEANANLLAAEISAASESAAVLAPRPVSKHERNAKAFELAVSKYGTAVHSAKRAVELAKAKLVAAEKKAQDLSRSAIHVFTAAQKMMSDIDEDVARESLNLPPASKRPRTHGHAEWDGRDEDAVDSDESSVADTARIERALKNLRLMAKKKKIPSSGRSK